jgi:hypothetical protein
LEIGPQTNIDHRTGRAIWLSLIMMISILLLSWLSFTFAFTLVTRVSDPAKTLTLNAKEPVALAIQADQFLPKSLQDKPLQKRIAGWAVLSLESQALNPRALRIWGFVHLSGKSRATALRAMELAIRASRQEVGAHVWLIEDSVAQQDIARALKHYDLVLRTSALSRAALQPLLINALEDEQILAAFVPYVKRRPLWLYPFFEQAIRESKNPQNVAALLMRAGGLPDGHGYVALENAMLSQLIAKQQFAAAKSYFLSLKGSDSKLLTSPGLFSNNVSDRFLPMAWQPHNSSTSGMSIMKGMDQEAALLVYVGPGERGLVAHKTLFLESGDYHIGVRFGASQVPAGGGVRWSVTCAGSPPLNVLSQSDLLKPQANAISDIKFTVPANCLAQNMDIEMIGGQEQQGAEVEIVSIKLGIAKI